MGLMKLCSVPEPESFTVGLDLPLIELKMKLLEKDGPIISVVSAPPGCGKTTLLSKLCRDEEVIGKFKDSIFFLTVSNSPDLGVMIQNLSEHNRYQVPVLQSEAEKTNHLQLLLRQLGQDNPLLLVLDDAWRGSESLIEKFKVQLPDYKILVSSRFEFPSFGSTFRLEPLNKDDAKALFLHWRTARVNGSSSSSLESILLEKILKLCNGFPLLLKVLSRLSVSELKTLAMKRAEGKSVFDITPDKTLLECLQGSIDFLDNVHRECFSDLGSFPEDKTIRASTIIDMWKELYGLDEAGVYAKNYLEYLSDHNLLRLFCAGRDECEIDGFYNEFFFTQHDILRELAILQNESEPREKRKRLSIEIRGNRFPEFLRQPNNARLVSISTDESFLSRWDSMKFPEVEVLVLNFTSSNYVLPDSIAEMRKLKVLAATNYGIFPAQLMNFSVIGSLPNLKRITLDKVSLASLDLTALHLMNLEKISLVMCNIGEAFNNSSMNISNAFPNLLEIEIDYCPDLEQLPDWIFDITKLRRLSITNCNKLSKLPRAIGNLVNLEVLRLTSCINLSELPDTVGRLLSLSYIDVSDCLSIKELPIQIGKLPCLKKLCMRKCSSCRLPVSIKNLKDLEVVCDEETALLWKGFELSLRGSKPTVLPKDEHNLNWLATL